MRKTIREFIENNLAVFDDMVEFADDDNIFEQGLVNSLFALMLLSFVENKWEIIIEDEDIEISNFSSIDNIMRFINKKKGTDCEKHSS